jgi:hypothetical protein
MKNIVNIIDQNGSGFMCMKQKYPKSREAKIKAGLFVGQQIEETLRDGAFGETLSV